MKYDLVQWLIGTDLVLFALLLTATSTIRKKVTANMVESLSRECVIAVLQSFSGFIKEKSNLQNHDHAHKSVAQIIIKSRPLFSCFTDSSLFLLYLSFITFSAFFSHSVTSFVFKYQNPVINENFVYTAAFISSVIYFVNAILFLIFKGTGSLLFSYITLKELDIKGFNHGQ